MAKDRFLKQLWISFGIIVVSITAAALAISFYTGNLSSQADAIVADRAAIQQQTDSVQNLASLEHAVPQAAQYQVAMNRLLPDQYGTVTFGQWFTQVGRKYAITANAQLQGSSVTPSQGTTPGGASFAFDAEGSPANLMSFLDEVSSKSSGFLLSFGSFEFTSDDSADAKVTGQGTIFFR